MDKSPIAGNLHQKGATRRYIPNKYSNTRRSVDMRKLQPKKGKGGWGKPGDEEGIWRKSDQEKNLVYLDENDPNYDPDEDHTGEVEVETNFFNPEEFQRNCNLLIAEYFSNGEAEEVLNRLYEYEIPTKHHSDFVENLVLAAMDKNDPQRELASVLLSEVYNNPITPEEISNGMIKLLEKADDAKLDIPQFSFHLSRFIARAVADDILPPAFFNKEISGEGKNILQEAKSLWELPHGLSRLASIWQDGGGLRPVMLLSKKMKVILEEYLTSHDIDEARRCLKELEVPHFHHEFVYQGIVFAMDGSPNQERHEKYILDLFKSMTESADLLQDQMEIGVERIFKDVTDIHLDYPNAYTFLSKFIKKCAEEKCISAKLVDKIPVKPDRKSVV